MFQSSSLYKNCKWKHSASYGNYSGSVWVGSARLTCDCNCNCLLELSLAKNKVQSHMATILFPVFCECHNILKRSKKQTLCFFGESRSCLCILPPGRQIHWEPGNQVPTKVQANFLVGFTYCHELISLTKGCELTRNEFF